MKPLVIYHKSCADGWCSAWLARKALKDADFFPAQYGEEPPDVSDREVYVLDFSYPRKTLLSMAGKCKSLIVLDHHKTAAKDLEGLHFCLFDMSRSGAKMTWDYFNFPDKSWIVDYVQDRDLWKWELSNSQEVSAAISSLPYDFDAWDELSKTPLEEVVSQGKAIRRYMDRLIETLASFGKLVIFNDCEVLAVNSSMLQSEVGNRLAQRHPFGIVWFQRQDGQFVYSLRSTNEGKDVSEIAKSLGGGGHTHSAGFVSNKLLV